MKSDLFAAVDAAYEEIVLAMAGNLSTDSAVTNPEDISPPPPLRGTTLRPRARVGPTTSETRGFHSPALDELDRQTREIVALLANPNAPGDRRKGLIMGSVQSGKTRNYAGVAAKAADVGYKMIIVLAGMHDNLRDQTQSRLDEQLFDGETFSFAHGHPSQDYRGDPGSGANPGKHACCCGRGQEAKHTGWHNLVTNA